MQMRDGKTNRNGRLIRIFVFVGILEKLESPDITIFVPLFSTKKQNRFYPVLFADWAFFL